MSSHDATASRQMLDGGLWPRPARPGRAGLLVGLLETVQHLEDLIRRCTEIADDLAVIRILLSLERASCFVDVSQTFRDLLPVTVGHSEHTVRRRCSIFINLSPA